MKYQAPTHTSKWERLNEYKIGRRTLLPGQVVKITGERGALFKFLYAERNVETSVVNLTFVGGRTGYRLIRCFTPDKVGKFVGTVAGETHGEPLSRGTNWRTEMEMEQKK